MEKKNPLMSLLVAISGVVAFAILFRGKKKKS